MISYVKTYKPYKHKTVSDKFHPGTTHLSNELLIEKQFILMTLHSSLQCLTSFSVSSFSEAGTFLAFCRSVFKCSLTDVLSSL